MQKKQDPYQIQERKLCELFNGMQRDQAHLLIPKAIPKR